MRTSPDYRPPPSHSSEKNIHLLKIPKNMDLNREFLDMDPRNGWIEKGGSRSLQDKTIIERIMLRYRPIAPKPAAGGSVPEEGKADKFLGKARKKRKYVRVKQTRRCKMDKKKRELETQSIYDFEFMQPKLSGFQGFNESGSSVNLDFKVEERIPGWMMKLDKNKSGGNNNGFFVDKVDRTVESWIMVEGVSVTTDIWFVKEGGLGCTDMEKMKNLEMDVCPGLISDGLDRVQWMNLAYRKLVDPPKDDEEPPAQLVAAWLVLKEKLPVHCQGFACTVRVVYSWGNNSDNHNNKKKKYVSQTMPCDVWRMDFGGFAWRLDSKAALSLGR